MTKPQLYRHIRNQNITIVTFTPPVRLCLSAFMNTNIHTNTSTVILNLIALHPPQPRASLRRSSVLAAATGILFAAMTASADDDLAPAPQIGSVFIIAMENHNFTQPNPTNSPQQILGNPAAPYINSLITPGNPNAAQVSYATAYFNAGFHVHPSEPNYVWAEAGSDFGAHTDADPRSANGNTFYNQSNHLAGLLNAAGIPWNNYQEDVQLSVSPTNSASGTNGPVNPYYGTTQFNYAVKHNPMAFFADTDVQNVYPLAQLFLDLNNNSVAPYNWITPNQYDDAHSSLNGGFTYQGIHYTGDQSSVAQGDNFLSQVIPQIMASQAYQSNGVIIIWWDESENGDDTNHTVPEIIISPLAKGSAYASAVPVNHSSDIKTMAEIFRLPLLNNPVPLAETNSANGYNNVATVNDLSDLFVPGAIPAPPTFEVHQTPPVKDPVTQHFIQLVNIKNTSSTPVAAPLFLALDNLSTNATLLNSEGATAVLAPLGSPYVSVRIKQDQDDSEPIDDPILRPQQSVPVVLEFLASSVADINYDTRVLNVTPVP